MIHFHRRHRSFFPVILTLLTLALVTLVILSVRPAAERPAAPVASEAPSDAEYREGLREAMRPYFEGYDAAGNDLDRLLLVERVLGELLALTVPSAYKETHLEIAIGLNRIRSGLRGEGGDIEAGRARIEAAAAGNPWLK